MTKYNDLSSFITALKNRKISPDTTLDLSNSLPIDLDLETLVKELQSGKCPRRMHIDLSQNNINKIKLNTIMAALASGKCPSDLELNLGGNNINDDDALNIAGFLIPGQCPQGLRLDLRNNNIGYDGLLALKTTLRLQQDTGMCFYLNAVNLNEEQINTLIKTDDLNSFGFHLTYAEEIERAPSLSSFRP